jgi:hypothetical protein
MEILLTAIVAAVAKVEVQEVKFNYEKLKTKIQEKLGKDNEVKKAMDEIEKKPTSHARVEVLKEEIQSKALENDAEITVLAKALLEIINEQQPGDEMRVNQEISGTGDVIMKKETLE